MSVVEAFMLESSLKKAVNVPFVCVGHTLLSLGGTAEISTEQPQIESHAAQENLQVESPQGVGLPSLQKQ